jgi:hypothetical protein
VGESPMADMRQRKFISLLGGTAVAYSRPPTR